MLHRLRRSAKRAGDTLLGTLAVAAIKLLRLGSPDRTSDIAAWLMRGIGPLFPESKIARANLTAAFPEKSRAEIEAILAGVWDNLGRLGAEFAHLDHIWEHDRSRPQDSRIEIQQRTGLTSSDSSARKRWPGRRMIRTP